jgi:phosphoribosylformimino-5-aminoimidazole carboxamide ribotide isomerase
MMRVIPAIDLRGGKCVRLLQGDFAKTTEYSDDPVEQARLFAEMDVRDLHIVDLDGAATGIQSNSRIVRRICDENLLDVQLGGGIRDAASLRHWLDHGVRRCVIGSLAVTDAALVRGWLQEFGAQRIVLALDVRLLDEEPYIATHGWTRLSDTVLWQALDSFVAAGLQHLLCTDINRDGALSGPNIELYSSILKRYPGLELQASGGVRDAADLRLLEQENIPAAITGRALLDGRISATEVARFRPNA